VVVSSPSTVDLADRLRIDEIAAARAGAATLTKEAAKETGPANARGDLEVTAATTPEAGLLEGLVGAVLGFLFG
jgi:hypothetical protein